jgi:hypothetical protein
MVKEHAVRVLGVARAAQRARPLVFVSDAVLMIDQGVGLRKLPNSGRTSVKVEEWFVASMPCGL